MAKFLNKVQVKRLLKKLDVKFSKQDNYSELKSKLLKELPDYDGKCKYYDIKRYVDKMLEERANRINATLDDMDIFANYQPPKQPQSKVSAGGLSIKDLISNNLKHGEDFTADLSTVDDKTQEDYLMGLVEALKSAKLTFGKKYLTIRLMYGDNHECMRNINSRTLKHLLHLIDVLDGKAADTVEDFTDSDKAILMAFMQLKGFALEWYEYKRPTKAGAYFPYYNLNDELDLSMFGIYHKYDNIDYSDNCFIIASINSHLFTNEEIEFMRSLVNTRYLPRDDLKFIAELFNVGISISYFNSKRNKIDKAVKFNKDAPRQLRLLLRCGHYMLYHDELVPANKYEVHNLNTLITKMLNNNEFELIADINAAEKFMTHNFEFEHLEYTPVAVRSITPSYKHNAMNFVTAAVYTDNHFNIIINHKVRAVDASDLFYTLPEKSLVYIPDLKEIVNIIPTSTDYKITPTMYHKTVQQIKLTAKNSNKTIWLRSFKTLTSIDASNSNIDEFRAVLNTVRRTVKELLHVNLDDYTSLPKMSYNAAQSFGCFNNVYAVSGIVQAFAKRCIHGGLIKTLHDGMFEVDNVTCLDINSSYGTSMHKMQGIPQGKPKPFYKTIPEDACYALIQCNISNIKSDKLGRYTFIAEGINFIDSVLLEELKKYVDCTIEIINGYYYNEGFNNKINKFAEVLYQMRSINSLNKFGKNMLSCLYGKTLQSSAQYKIVIVPKSDINDFLADNGNYVFEIIKKPSDVYVVKLMRSINMNYNLPHFGVQVLSESRKRMNDIINYCNNNSISIYSIKTDSFVIDSSAVNKFAQKYMIGSDLGNFKVEYEAKHIKFTSKTCYKAVLTDDSIRTRGKVN